MGSEEDWSAFCQALGSPAWAQEGRFDTLAHRLENVVELDSLVSDWTRQRTAQETTDLLQAHGVAAMPVMNIEDQFLDPHLQERQAYLEVEHPHVGIEWLYGMPWLLGSTPGGISRPAPLLGQHNDYILGELLGFPAREIERLQAAQVIY